jgi:toxin ParE1/3/4
VRTYSVIISDEAEADLVAIYDYIADRAGTNTAFRFVESIETYCLGFASVPERGTRRDDVRPGLRTVGFRRRATILFEFLPGSDRVVIHGIYYAGRSLSPDQAGDAEY